MDSYAASKRIEIGGEEAAFASAEPKAINEAYAYIVPAGSEANLKLVIQLIQEGYKVRVFKNWFELNGKRYPKGTFAIISLRNGNGLVNRLNELNRNIGQM